jgi:sperm-associated antigen 16 protein
VSCDSDGITKTWDMRQCKEIQSMDSGLNSANCAVYDRSGSFVYVASDDSSIKVFNVNTGEKEGELKGHEDAVLDLTWDNHKDGYLISSGSDCSFRLWQ